MNSKQDEGFGLASARASDKLYSSLAPNLSNGISQYLLQPCPPVVFHHDLDPNRYRQGQNHNDVEDCHCDKELLYIWIGRAPRDLRDVHPVYSGDDRNRCKASVVSNFHRGDREFVHVGERVCERCPFGIRISPSYLSHLISVLPEKSRLLNQMSEVLDQSRLAVLRRLFLLPLPSRATTSFDHSQCLLDLFCVSDCGI
jgi:hypothetical protein